MTSRLVDLPPNHVFYVTALRATAAVLITNAHFVGVYPVDQLASGGLLGDVLFFAIAGFSLSVGERFDRWYLKRAIRIYVPVLLATLAYMIVGLYEVTAGTAFSQLVFPTNYHFVASIMVLYPLMFLVNRIPVLSRNVPTLIVGVLVAQSTVFLTIYDSSYYHVDNVTEPFVRFVFLVAMLLGVHFRNCDQKYRARRSRADWPLVLVAAVAYFLLKTGLTSGRIAPELQVVNQMALLLLLYLLMRAFAGADEALRALPLVVRRAVVLVATVTLEIYVVQIPIIPIIAEGVAFPLDWLILVFGILGTAVLLNLAAVPVSRRAIAAISQGSRMQAVREA